MSTTIRNCIVTFSGLTVATLFAFLFSYYVPENSGNIALIYILALITIVRFTDGYLPGLVSSVIAVICVNFLFTYPFKFYIVGLSDHLPGNARRNASYKYDDRKYQAAGPHHRREG